MLIFSLRLSSCLAHNAVEELFRIRRVYSRILNLRLFPGLCVPLFGRLLVLEPIAESDRAGYAKSDLYETTSISFIPYISFLDLFINKIRIYTSTHSFV